MLRRPPRDACAGAVFLRQDQAFRRHPGRARRRRDRAADRERIRVRHWDDVACIILPMVATVAVIDAISGRIRRRLIGTAR
jgi:hypothetical protein